MADVTVGDDPPGNGKAHFRRNLSAVRGAVSGRLSNGWLLGDENGGVECRKTMVETKWLAMDGVERWAYHCWLSVRISSCVYIVCQTLSDGDGDGFW